MKHVVMFSGGVGSWATAKRVADKHGTDNLYLVFADVKGDNDNPHLGEDEDVYRFIDEAAAEIGGTLVKLKEGRSIWQVFKDDRFLGNSRLANCSKFLKQRPCREWLDSNCDPEYTTVYVGIDWSEMNRLKAIENAYKPYNAKAPLCEPPFMDKKEMLRMCREAGIEPPRSYEQGYPHANCGGACVRAGKGQWAMLLKQNKERYMFHEKQEDELRQYLGKDVTILREQVAGEKVLLTLRSFRERQEEQGSLFDDEDLDLGGCGCFVQDEGEV
jgi:hypothetical protein